MTFAAVLLLFLHDDGDNMARSRLSSKSLKEQEKKSTFCFAFLTDCSNNEPGNDRNCSLFTALTPGKTTQNCSSERATFLAANANLVTSVTSQLRGEPQIYGTINNNDQKAQLADEQNLKPTFAPHVWKLAPLSNRQHSLAV